MKKLTIALIAMLSLFQFCDNNSSRKPNSAFELAADLETKPVQAAPEEDAADDPAIWVNWADKSKSIIFGTNKIETGGIYAYNLAGQQLAYYQLGRINNIDVTYNFPKDNQNIDLLGGSNRTDSTLIFMEISPAGELNPLGKIKSNLAEVYGFCFHHDLSNQLFYAIVVGKSGKLEQWKLSFQNGQIAGQLVRAINVGSKSEGLVCDDENNVLYVAEEENCIWKYSTDPTTNNDRKKIPMSGQDNPNIAFDLEGLTLYYLPEGKGYLIASSQGNHSYAIFDRKTDEYITSFSLIDGAVDGVQETDGIAVVNTSLNTKGGMLVVQDGFNYDSKKKQPQNFKYVNWQDIVNANNQKLTMDGDYRAWK